MHTRIQETNQDAGVTRTGKIIALCYSAELINGVGKEPHDEAQITQWGVPGDRHYGETRFNSQGVVIPNDRPITVVGIEAARDACERLGCEPIAQGGLGENILVEGMGDLGDLAPGDELRFRPPNGGETSVELEVRKQNDPCSNLSIYHKLMVKELYGKRGVICTVLKEGTLRLGDRVELVRATVPRPDDAG